MNNWESYLKKSQLSWLLEEDNPSVKYFTMVDLLDKPRDCPEVIRAKQEILQKGIAPKILTEQKEEGYWKEAGKFYTIYRNARIEGGRHSGVIPFIWESSRH